MQTDRSRTLFLDRDGVINRQIKGDYVRNTGQFEFLPGSIEAIVAMRAFFGRIVVVTNQQGVGKGLMSLDDLIQVHHYLSECITEAGGNIDRIYFCTKLASENDPCRKPDIGMALQAKADFPEIDFSNSVMVGDSESDIKFGKKAGMRTVLIHQNPEQGPYFGEDLTCYDLMTFVNSGLSS